MTRSGNRTSGGKCPFCGVPKDRVLWHGELCLALWDGYPVSDGHALVTPRRHVGSWFEATEEERAEILVGLDRAREAVLQRWKPDGFNIGINDGAAAGQTVPHLHVHLIPRFRGDVADPRGGVRWVIPSKARYWDRDDT